MGLGESRLGVVHTPVVEPALNAPMNVPVKSPVTAGRVRLYQGPEVRQPQSSRSARPARRVERRSWRETGRQLHQPLARGEHEPELEAVVARRELALERPLPGAAEEGREPASREPLTRP